LDAETLRWLIDAVIVIALALGGAFAKSILQSIRQCVANLETLRADIWKDGGLKDILEQQVTHARHRMVEDLAPKFGGQESDIADLQREMKESRDRANMRIPLFDRMVTQVDDHEKRMRALEQVKKTR